jgi:hypothetical protein
VSAILSPSRILIKEINSNHEARTPEGLARNVILIRELNKNVSEVKHPSLLTPPLQTRRAISTLYPAG